jgi:hypothetical protein
MAVAATMLCCVVRPCCGDADILVESGLAGVDAEQVAAEAGVILKPRASATRANDNPNATALISTPRRIPAKLNRLVDAESERSAQKSIVESSRVRIA